MGSSSCLTSHTQSRLAAGTEFTTCQHAFTEGKRRWITIRPLSLSFTRKSTISVFLSLCFPVLIWILSLCYYVCLLRGQTTSCLCVCACVCVGEAIQYVMTALAGPSVVRPSHLHPAVSRWICHTPDSGTDRGSESKHCHWSEIRLWVFSCNSGDLNPDWGQLFSHVHEIDGGP